MCIFPKKADPEPLQGREWYSPLLQKNWKKKKAFIINWNIHWRNCSYTPRVPYSSLEISNKNSFLLTAFISGHSSYLSKDELIVYLHSREMFMYPCTDAAVYPCPPEHIDRYSPFFFLSTGPQVVWAFPDCFLHFNICDCSILACRVFTIDWSGFLSILIKKKKQFWNVGKWCDYEVALFLD